MLLATEMRSHDMELFAGIDLPIVLLDNYFPSVRYDSVGIDNRYGAWNAVRYLIECGHIQLGYLHSSVEIRNFAERYDGYLYGCRSLPEGVAKDSSRRIVRVGSSAETAAKDMRAYLATEPMLPSAFFADNDQIAAGCCRALLEEGIRIPQDISIIGFDDSSICTMMSPQLTTMGVHKKRMGGLAVSRLHERLQYHMPEPECIGSEPVIFIGFSKYFSKFSSSPRFSYQELPNPPLFFAHIRQKIFLFCTASFQSKDFCYNRDATRPARCSRTDAGYRQERKGEDQSWQASMMDWPASLFRM